MRLVIIAVYDSAAQAFNRPFFAPSVGIALRSFQDEVSRQAPDNVMASHPSDFELFELGFFDDSVGSFEINEVPRSLMRAKDVTNASL